MITNFILLLMISLSYTSLRIFIAFILLSFSLSLHPQGMTLNRVRYLTAAPTFEEPADELSLLPDTASYYVVEELFNADTLTRRGNQLTFYNYGNTRYAIYSDLNTNTYVANIIKLQRISDTFGVQTSTRFERRGLEIDSTMVWWNEGLITRASVIRFNKIRTDYTYVYENGRLVHRIKQGLKYGKSETRYSYADGRLIKIIYQDQTS